MSRIAAAAAVLVIAACATIAWRGEMPPTAPALAFDQGDIIRGATLAAIGDCAICHTAAKGSAFAGGRALRTGFGTIYASNITPDPETGIGQWSLAAFTRAMREGIGRDGRHLYPALPYQHFTGITDPDMKALYAFIMTRAPVRAETPANLLTFPANLRLMLAAWNLLFFDHAAWRPDPDQSAAWNRGAYLVETLGHCGACHTPRNSLGAEQGAKALAGGEVDGWDAPALRATASSGAPWTEDSLTDYLRTGFASGHGAASGPMTAVTEALSSVPEDELRAIAVYIRSGLTKEPAAPVVAKAGQSDAGDPAAPLFAGACGGCHGVDAPMTRAGGPSLALSTAVNAPAPHDVIQAILHGLPWREGKPAPYMPGFAAALSDAQIAALTRYVRASYGHGPVWTDLEHQVQLARREGVD